MVHGRENETGVIVGRPPSIISVLRHVRKFNLIPERKRVDRENFAAGPSTTHRWRRRRWRRQWWGTLTRPPTAELCHYEQLFSGGRIWPTNVSTDQRTYGENVRLRIIISSEGTVVRNGEFIFVFISPVLR